MVVFKDLLEAYFTCRRHKRRSEDAVDYEIDYEKRLFSLLKVINDREIKEYSNYTFITLIPRPREVFAADMDLRIIQSYVVARITPLIERKLIPTSFNNRKNYGSEKAVNNVIDDIYEVSHGYTKSAWIIKYDLKGYFPNANCDIIYNQLIDLVKKDYKGNDKEDLLISAMNSYLGMIRACTELKEYNRIINSLSKDWFNYIYIDNKKKIIKIKKYYLLRESLIRINKLNLHDKRRNRRIAKQSLCGNNCKPKLPQ